MAGWVDALSAGLGAYVGYKQGQERKEDRALSKKRDEALTAWYEKQAGIGAKPPTPAPAVNQLAGVGATVPGVMPEEEEKKMADGGMVAMPLGDRMDWQRQSFKKR